MRNWTKSKDGDTSRLFSSKDNCHQPLLLVSNGLSENTACHHNNLIFLISFPCWVTAAPQHWSLYSGFKKNKKTFPTSIRQTFWKDTCQQLFSTLGEKRLKLQGHFLFSCECANNRAQIHPLYT